LRQGDFFRKARQLLENLIRTGRDLLSGLRIWWMPCGEKLQMIPYLCFLLFFAFLLRPTILLKILAAK
jgi:hypothetical protein